MARDAVHSVCSLNGMQPLNRMEGVEDERIAIVVGMTRQRANGRVLGMEQLEGIAGGRLVI